MAAIMRMIAVALAAALAAAGCDSEPMSSAERPPRTSKRHEERQAIRRDVRLITSHCLGRPRPRLAGEPPRAGHRSASARQAGVSVSSLLARLERRADAEFYEQYRWRGQIAAMADFLEHNGCLARWVPRIDRTLRRLPLAEPPPDYVEEYVPEPEPEDYGRYP
jgi:hypothetical protein